MSDDDEKFNERLTTAAEFVMAIEAAGWERTRRFMKLIKKDPNWNPHEPTRDRGPKGAWKLLGLKERP